METTFVIPKKELSSWQKWEFNALDSLKFRQKKTGHFRRTLTPTPEQAKEMPAPPPPPSPSATVTEQEISETEIFTLPTAEQIEEIYQQAREEGKVAGYAEGKEQAAYETTRELHQLKTLIHQFEQEFKQMDQTVAEELLNLSIVLAKKIAGQALRVRPKMLLPIVKEALRQLPATTQPIRLILHPDDALQIKERLQNQLPHIKWQIHEDIQVKPGGCRLESGGSEVDATLATRWQHALEPLGQDHNWLV